MNIYDLIQLTQQQDAQEGLQPVRPIPDLIASLARSAASGVSMPDLSAYAPQSSSQEGLRSVRPVPNLIADLIRSSEVGRALMDGGSSSPTVTTVRVPAASPGRPGEQQSNIGELVAALQSSPIHSALGGASPEVGGIPDAQTLMAPVDFGGQMPAPPRPEPPPWPSDVAAARNAGQAAGELAMPLMLQAAGMPSAPATQGATPQSAPSPQTLPPLSPEAQAILSGPVQRPASAGPVADDRGLGIVAAPEGYQVENPSDFGAASALPFHLRSGQGQSALAGLPGEGAMPAAMQDLGAARVPGGGVRFHTMAPASGIPVTDRFGDGGQVVRQDASGRSYFADTTPAGQVDGDRLAYAQARQQERETHRGRSPSGPPSDIPLTTAQLVAANAAHRNTYGDGQMVSHQGEGHLLQGDPNPLYSDVRGGGLGDPARRQEARQARQEELAARGQLVQQHAAGRRQDRQDRMLVRERGPLGAMQARGEISTPALIAMMGGSPATAAQLQYATQAGQQRLQQEREQFERRMGIEQGKAEADQEASRARAGKAKAETEAIQRQIEQSYTPEERVRQSLQTEAQGAGPGTVPVSTPSVGDVSFSSGAAFSPESMPQTFEMLNLIFNKQQTPDGRSHNWGGIFSGVQDYINYVQQHYPEIPREVIDQYVRERQARDNPQFYGGGFAAPIGY